MQPINSTHVPNKNEFRNIYFILGSFFWQANEILIHEIQYFIQLLQTKNPTRL
jgi:hypothetical protein